MTKPLILLFVGIGISVLLGVLVVAVMVRTRRPGGGYRNWIRQSADSWQENGHRAPKDQLGKRVRLNALLQEATPADSANPLKEMETLRNAAGQIWGQEVEHFEAPQAAKDSEKVENSADSADSLEESTDLLPGQLPPAFTPRECRRPPAAARLQVVKEPEDATSYVPQVKALSEPENEQAPDTEADFEVDKVSWQPLKAEETSFDDLK